MALVNSYSDETAIYEFSYTAGTGTYLLAGAWSTHLPFSDRYPAGAVGITYYVKDGSSGVGAQFEISVGDYDVGAKTLTRTSILASSNGDAAVNWSGRTRLLIRLLIEVIPPAPIDGVHFPPPAPPPPPPEPPSDDDDTWDMQDVTSGTSI